MLRVSFFVTGVSRDYNLCLGDDDNDDNDDHDHDDNDKQPTLLVHRQQILLVSPRDGFFIFGKSQRLGRHVCVDCVKYVHPVVFETPTNSYQTWCSDFLFEADPRPPKNSLRRFL